MKYLVSKPSLVGFLSAVYHSYKLIEGESTVFSDTLPKNMLDEYVDVDENVEYAKAVRAGIIKKGGTAFFDEICDAYRSCNLNKERIIFDYLALFFKAGKNIINMYDKPEVVAFNDVVRKVWHEIHRLDGFIRFMEMSNGVYYGYYSSDNDILERVAPLFIPRLNAQKFVLHDYQRQKMCYYDGNRPHYMLADKVDIELSEREMLFQALWKQYHKNVTIAARENPRLQRQFLPKKYRHFMLEF